MNSELPGPLVSAAAVNGFLAGASMFRSLIELPVWEKNQLSGFYRYARAADLGRGFVVYPVFGVGAALIVIAAAPDGYLVGGLSATTSTLLWLSAVLTIAHSVTTSRAAPNMLKLRNSPEEPDVIRPLFAGFKRWQDRRATLQVLTFISVLLTTASLVP
ncbi:MAG: hypothetical protein JRN06_06665 [Nitrososphaerota archaeon]|nr:hypothetical protein [Nitrososphaerota archaeon]MDG7024540.1 hypothetical protein [Nitrososphaerota archaeon]